MCDFLQLIQQASDEYKYRNSQCQKYKLINWSICKTKMNFWWIFTAIFFGMQLVIFSMCFAKKRIFFVIILTIGFKLWLSSLSAIMEIQFCDFIVFIYNVKIFKRKPFRIDFWNCQVHKMKQHTHNWLLQTILRQCVTLNFVWFVRAQIKYVNRSNSAVYSNGDSWTYSYSWNAMMWLLHTAFPLFCAL